MEKGWDGGRGWKRGKEEGVMLAGREISISFGWLHGKKGSRAVITASMSYSQALPWDTII